MATTVYVSGFGAYSPESRVTNQDLTSRVDTNDEWIVTRTGIRERRMLAQDQQASDLAAEAARRALHRAGMAPESLTHTLVATCTPDTICPSCACVTAHKLGCDSVMAFDLSAACSGFLYGLNVASGMLAAAPNARLMVIGVEALTRRLNWQDRGTCVLFGDGAGACVISAAPGDNLSAKLVDMRCGADASKSELIMVGGGSSRAYLPGDPIHKDFFVSMQGREVFKHAVRAMASVSRDILAGNGLTIEDVDLFVPHQANLRIIEAVGQRMGIAAEKVFVNVETHGNTSAASIPLALSEAIDNGRIKPGMKVLLTTFGSGFTWASALLQF